MKKLERLEKKIKANAKKYIDALYEKEKYWATLSEQEFVEAEERSRIHREYYFSTYVEETRNGNLVLAVTFDGGRMFDEINSHWYLKSGGNSENWEDWIEDSWFDEEKAEKIFGLKNLEWAPYASWRLDIYV